MVRATRSELLIYPHGGVLEKVAEGAKEAGGIGHVDGRGDQHGGAHLRVVLGPLGEQHHLRRAAHGVAQHEQRPLPRHHEHVVDERGLVGNAILVPAESEMGWWAGGSQVAEIVAVCGAD